MKNYSLKIKKVIVLPLIVILVFFSFGTPKKAEAAAALSVPTWDGLGILEQIAQSLVRAAANLAQQAGRISVDQAAYAAGQMLLNQVTDNTISWIRGGFNGSPSYAINPEKLFLDLSDSVAGTMSHQIRGLATCDFTPTFNNDLANAVDLSTRSNADNKFAEQVRCPFPSGVGVSASDFYNAGVTTFQQNGGWDALQSALDDAGNPFGMRVLVGQELTARQETAQRIQEQKLSRSNGFLDIVDTSSCHYPAGMDTSFEGVDPGPKASLQREYCDITTPGKIAGDQLTHALGIDMDRLGFVDNINKIYGAIIRRLTQDAVHKLF